MRGPRGSGRGRRRGACKQHGLNCLHHSSVALAICWIVGVHQKNEGFLILTPERTNASSMVICLKWTPSPGRAWPNFHSSDATMVTGHTKPPKDGPSTMRTLQAAHKHAWLGGWSLGEVGPALMSASRGTRTVCASALTWAYHPYSSRCRQRTRGRGRLMDGSHPPLHQDGQT